MQIEDWIKLTFALTVIVKDKVAPMIKILGGKINGDKIYKDSIMVWDAYLIQLTVLPT